MRVLIVVPWDQEAGGVASVVGNLAKYLVGREHDARFLNVGDSDALVSKLTKWGFDGYELTLRAPISARSSVRSIVSFLAHLPGTMRRILRCLREARPGIVNVHYPIEGFVYFGFLRLLCPIKLVVSVHGADLFPKGRRKGRYPIAMKMLLWSADRIVAPSQSLRDEVAALNPAWGRKAIYIHNGIDLDELRAPSAAGPAPAGPYLLCIAAHNEKKGQDVLLRAFAQVARSEPSLRLALVGDGHLRPELERLAEALGVSGRVDFLGWRTRPEIAALLKGCEAFVLPSRSEPFGIVLIEAMACRKPVVASAVGGIVEIIENGVNGILVRPDDPDALAGAIQEVLANVELRGAIAAKGEEKVIERFRIENTGAAYLRLFEELAG